MTAVAQTGALLLVRRETAPFVLLAVTARAEIVPDDCGCRASHLTTGAADLAALVREVDQPRVRMMYDTFHAHIEEKDPRGALRACSDVLVHFHASENDRGTPGTGRVDRDATFDELREIGYDGWIVIEAFGDALPELAAATKLWRRLFESEEQLARAGHAFLRSRF